MFLRRITYNSGPFVKGEIMKFVKRLAIYLLLIILFFIVAIIGLVCPAGLIIIGIICHSLWFILGGAIWLIVTMALYFTVEDEMEKQLKEEFKI